MKDDEISLSLSYITYSASWSPRYDLSLNSVKCTGSLDYGAELKNATSEIWEGAKVVLSTSQTTFSGLSESIPYLHPWHVKLVKGKHTDSALLSQKEIRAKQVEYNSKTGNTSQKPRWEVFGRDSAPIVHVGHHFRNSRIVAESNLSMQAKKSRRRQVDEVMNNYSAPMPAAYFGTTSSTAPIGGGYGSGGPQLQRVMDHGGEPQYFARRAMDVGGYAAREEAEDEDMDDEEMGFGLFDSDDGPKPLVFEEGAWEESGMTTVCFNSLFSTLNLQY